MAVSAKASYTYTYVGGEDLITIEVWTDASYSPDLASDLATRARTSLAATVAETWPQPVADA